MSDASARSFQTLGASVVLITFVAFSIYAWRWGASWDMLPYVVGILCTALAGGWAAYERS